LSLLLHVRLGCKGFRFGESNKGAFVEFLCIHHSAETRNDLQLEQDVERDPEGRTTGRRKRGDTRMNPNLDVNGDVKAKAGKVVSRGPPAPEAGVDLTHVSDSESEGRHWPTVLYPRLEDPAT
jgi:hypothetical protein